MPTGKTEEAVRHIARLLESEPDARIMISTFRVTLSDKLENDFGHGFVNYQTCTGVIDEQLLIVQLDSMWRVLRQRLAMFLADESLSLFLHTGSTVMKDPLGVMQSLHFFIANAERIIMLDACVDDFPSYRMVQCIERIRGVSARWIRNTHVAMSRRTAAVEVCKSDSTLEQRAFRDSAIAKVLKLVREGHKVYVPCSTRRDAEAVWDTISREIGVVGDDKGKYGTKKARLPTTAPTPTTPGSSSSISGSGRGGGGEGGDDEDGEGGEEPPPVRTGPPVRVLLITSETQPGLRKEVAKNINGKFAEADVAILSPAVTAGSSCTVERFTACVCIAENCGHLGPTVDSCLQQWWRVRSLGADGRMFVYILDPPSVVAKAGPTDAEEITEFIDANICTSFNFLSSGLRSAARSSSAQLRGPGFDRSRYGNWTAAGMESRTREWVVLGFRGGRRTRHTSLPPSFFSFADTSGDEVRGWWGGEMMCASFTDTHSFPFIPPEGR